MKRFVISQNTILLALFFVISACSQKSSNPQPQKASNLAITSINVTTGPYNTQVIINGTGFDATKANDNVFFNGKAATITAATITRLTATVPVGAGTGVVTVSVNNGTPVAGPVFTYQVTATVTTFAGSGLTGFTDSQGTGASFSGLWGIAIDPSGNLFVTDVSLVRKIMPDATVRFFAGNVSGGYQDGKGSLASFQEPWGITCDATGNLYVADMLKIRKVTPDGTVSTIQSSSAFFADYKGVVLDAAGNLFALDAGNRLILKISTDGATGTLASDFAYPRAICIDKAGDLFVADEGANKVIMVTSSGTVTTLAGSGAKGANDGPAMSASFKDITGIAVDAAGNVYVSDSGNYTIRMITPDGTVSTIAGNGIQGFKDGQGLSSQLFSPQNLSIDNSGNIYVADDLKVRKITLQ
ncbi:IPT/TIG domain-containing protein [Mucilaginibacter ginsenosidivorans]|uniref:IPT/TIG domain-containing protein n=1 Tax=Mucilaginibacter ginsenosidivorans TaxID=398053 RepID=A0A5B8UVY0_9SPHI|nr:IPT/TIG domain-containing protein [Mucilaginibacter ginsenosidivorans]QEC62895.1 hypothetical protein FRZ54_10000 [Mucilaginibacter ginsenosidivorans]